MFSMCCNLMLASPSEIVMVRQITWHSSRYLGRVSPYIIPSEYELFSVAKIIQIHFKIIIYLSAQNASSLFRARHYINCNLKSNLTSNGITPGLISLLQDLLQSGRSLSLFRVSNLNIIMSRIVHYMIFFHKNIQKYNDMSLVSIYDIWQKNMTWGDD